MRFSLVDKITDLQPGKSISAVKNLTLAEEYLADHFPGFPVMPGVLMVESLVQAGAWLMRHAEDFKYSTILLKDARAVRFNNFVSPGKTLVLNLSVHKWDGANCVLKGTGTVDGNSAVNGRITLEQFNLSDKNESMAESDKLRIDHFRGLFHQLWTPEESPIASD